MRNIVTKPADTRTILRVGPYADVGFIAADLELVDPPLQAVPVRLEAGGKVGRMALSLNWAGGLTGVGQLPISYRGGSINALEWVNTPPMFVAARRNGDREVDVVFNESVKAPDFNAGVIIKINGRAAEIKMMSDKLSNEGLVRYRLTKQFSESAGVTWAYDERRGFIANMSGDQLRTVTEQIVGGRSP